ncbi:MAG: hypothetical protein RIC55_14245 [Pirellulaceae bacterium]
MIRTSLALLTSLGCLLVASMAASGVSRAAELPREYPWQETLADYLGTLRADDFTVADHTFTYPAEYARADDERVYRDWIVLGHPGREPMTAGFHAPAESFTLAEIQGEAIRMYPEPAALAWWIQFDFPGNPYADNSGGKHRALVIAIVDMLMLESAQREDPRNLKPDFMGANLGTWAYTLHHCEDKLPANVREAYKQGMLHYLLKMERLAPRDGNTNMDMREIATLADLDLVLDDPAIHRRLVDDAKRILFGDPRRGPDTSDPRRGTFHPAGYIGEADGPETSYNGISLYHLAEAAMISRGDPDWDAFLPEVIRRMARFKAYNTFPQPDGSYEGPSSWAKRTNDPYVNDQRDRPWRPFAEAMITDEALFRLRVDPRTYNGSAFGLADREQMLSDIEKGVMRLTRSPRRPEGWKAAETPVWKEEHWPADLPYTWDHYVEGSYARFQKLVDEKSPLLLPPFEREADFNLDFDGEFWMAMHDDWGFQVEAVPHMGRSYDTGGSGALAGGSLAAFWTKKTGVTLLGRLPNKWNYVTWDKLPSWTTHHLWGRTAEASTVESSAFSSARQRDPWVRFETDFDSPQVHVFGTLGPPRTVEREGILDNGHVFYRRTFTKRNDGLHIRSELLSQGTDELSELWETLPVYLSGTGRNAGKDSLIEFRAGDRWLNPGTELVEEVAAIRITRGDGAVLIEFDKPQRARLSDVIETAYQKKDRLRTINLDLLGAKSRVGKSPIAMPHRAEVSYLIRPEK